jgi:plasmid stabilization system protein ParE
VTFKVEFTPEADADLDRLFDFVLERAQTVEDAMHAYEAVEVIRAVANSHLSPMHPPIETHRRRRARPRAR